MLAALGPLQCAGVIAVMAEEVVQVEIAHLVDFTDDFGAEIIAQQVVDQAAALRRLDLPPAKSLTVM